MSKSIKKLAVGLGRALLCYMMFLSPTNAISQPVGLPKGLSARSFNIGLYAVQRIAISHDGRKVAFLGYMLPTGVSRQFGVDVFDISSHQPLARLSITALRPQILEGGIAFSPDDQTLAAGVDVISLWDAHTWWQKVQIEGPFASGSYAARGLMNLAFSRDGETIIGFYDRVWAPGDLHVEIASDSVRLSEEVRQAYQEGRVPQSFQRPEIQIFDVQSTSRLKRIAIARQGQRGDRTIMTNGLVLSQDGKTAFVGVIDRDGLPSPPDPAQPPRALIQRVNLATGVVREVLDLRQEWMFTTFSVSPDDRLIATGEDAGEKISLAGGRWNTNTDPIRIWAVSDGRLEDDLPPLSGRAWRMAFLPDASSLVVCESGDDHHDLLSVWKLKGKSEVSVFQLKTRNGISPVCALAPDGSRAVVTLETGVAFGGVRPDTAFVVSLPGSS